MKKMKKMFRKKIEAFFDLQRKYHIVSTICVIFVVIFILSLCIVFERSNVHEDIMPEVEVLTSSSADNDDVSEELHEEDIFYDIEKYFYSIQEALKENSNNFEGISIGISEERTLIVEGIDLRYSIDSSEPKVLSNYAADEDGTWICLARPKMTFYVPESYEGDLYDFKLELTGTNGEIYYEEYKVPHIKLEQLPENCVYCEVGIGEDENGEEIKFYAPYKYEYLQYVEKFSFGVLSDIDVLYAPFNLFSEFRIVSFENDKILMINDSIMAVFDTNQKQFNIIASDVLEYEFTRDKGIFFINSDHDLYWCNWKINTNLVPIESESDV